MIRRPAGRCRIDAIEPEVAEFQRVDEHVDRANRIALVDPIIKAFRQQRRLLAIRTRSSSPDRQQTTLLPECLDDWVDESNPVRAVDVFVDALELRDLGFDGVDPACLLY